MIFNKGIVNAQGGGRREFLFSWKIYSFVADNKKMVSCAPLAPFSSFFLPFNSCPLWSLFLKKTLNYHQSNYAKALAQRKTDGWSWVRMKLGNGRGGFFGAIRMPQKWRGLKNKNARINPAICIIPQINFILPNSQTNKKNQQKQFKWMSPNLNDVPHFQSIKNKIKTGNDYA